jgi:PIN domain nuclease of toxin-antitoxin system
VPGYFLDTSALAKLHHQETGSELVERIVAVPGSAVISRLSLIEMESVFAIKVRTGQLDLPGQDLARR